MPGAPSSADASRRPGTLTPPLLVLWDIDHTLVDGADVAREAYAAAFRAATGRPLGGLWNFDGRTERAAATDALREHGLDPDGGLLDAFLKLLVAAFRERAAELTARGRALPGAVAALTALAALPGVRQSVLTGNLREVAALKLTAFGLADHLDLRLGGYGDDAYERADLPAHAFARTERHLGWRHTGADTVIIGDTLRDIATAHAAAARMVAVATGTVGLAELAAAGPDAALPDLVDTAAVLRAVTGPARSGSPPA